MFGLFLGRSKVKERLCLCFPHLFFHFPNWNLCSSTCFPFFFRKSSLYWYHPPFVSSSFGSSSISMWFIHRLLKISFPFVMNKPITFRHNDIYIFAFNGLLYFVMITFFLSSFRHYGWIFIGKTRKQSERKKRQRFKIAWLYSLFFLLFLYLSSLPSSSWLLLLLPHSHICCVYLCIELYAYFILCHII